MNKSVSKNSVLRFKLGRKIVKAQFGTGKIKIGMDAPKIYYLIPLYDLETILKISSIPSIPARPYPYRGSKIKIGILKIPDISPSVTSADPYLTSGSTKGGMLREYEQNLVNNLASKEFKSKKTPVNNIWIKGFNRHPEVKDVRAMLNKLIKLGLLKDKFGADGKWGKNTEAAYEVYKKIAFNPQTIPAVELIEKTPDYMDSPINNSQVDLVGIAKQYLYAKQGGLLPSKNLLQRFKYGGVLKFQNAGNLPTAPKAEDRYKYSFKSSETTPQGEEIKTVKVAPTGYWKFPATILQRVNSQNDTTYIEVPTHTSILGSFIRPRVHARTVIKNANLPYNIGTYLTFTPSFVGPLFSPSNKLEYETLKQRFNTAWNLAK